MKRILSLLIALLFLLLATDAKVFAISNPNSTTIKSVKVFQNIFAANDVLFVTSYDIDYITLPTEPASYTFEMALLNTSNAVIRRKPVEYYGYNLISIYFDPASAAAELTWGSEYTVKIQSNPAFLLPVAGITMDTEKLSASAHWITGTASASRKLLRQYLLTVANAIEAAEGSTLVVDTPTGEVLNTAGRTIFIKAIPGLDSVLPELFQIAYASITTTQSTATGAYEIVTALETQLGADIKAAFDGVGTYLNISGQSVAGIWILLFIVTVASIAFLNTGNVTAAMIISLPIALIGAWTGAIPLALIFTFAIVIVIYLGYQIWLKGI